MRASMPDVLDRPESPRPEDIDPGDIAPGTEFVVEAASVDRAVADVRERLGAEPEILSVDTVTRGGIGGFFAREIVQVRVRASHGSSRGPAESPARRPAREHVAEARPAGVDQVLAKLTAAEDQREQRFEDSLRRELARPVTGADRGSSNDSRRIAAEDLGTRSDPIDRPAPDETVAVVEEVTPEPSAAHSAGAPPPPRDDLSIFPPEIADRLAGMARPAIGDGTTTARASAAGASIASGTDIIMTDVHPVVVPVTSHQLDRPTASPVVADAGGLPVLPADRSAAAEQTPVAPTRVERTSGVHWSLDNLRRLGLPSAIVDECRDLDPNDEIRWLEAISDAVAVLCRPVPSGSAVLVGPRAVAMAGALGIEAVEEGERPPYGGTVGLGARDDLVGRMWVEQVRGDRWYHLVIGGSGWEKLVFEEPLAVSWVGTQALPKALDLCASFGLVLGYGMADESGPARRATPVDVALAVRDLLPRDEGL